MDEVVELDDGRPSMWSPLFALGFRNLGAGLMVR